jgi:Asp-tRNA(Asn)/Glu-tRNA(Gln) amidotransferase A subunit family amidase
MGVQIVGRRFADALTLHVAEEIEAISGGWRLGEIESPTRAPRPKSRLDHRTLTG